MALGAVVYIGGRALGYFGGSSSFYPKDVISKPYLKAESLLRAQGLVPNVTFQTGTVGSKGLVQDQNPGTNQLVKKHDVVHLVVSRGPNPVFLPYVVNLPLTQVKGQLRSSGFVLHVVYERSSNRACRAVTIHTARL